MQVIHRIFVEKQEAFAVEALHILKDIKENLNIPGLENLRILHRYDISDLTALEYQEARETIFAEPAVDNIYDEEVSFAADEQVFAIELLPGQYDQRADSAAQCIAIITHNEKPLVRYAKIVVLKGLVSAVDIERIKAYAINKVEAREAKLEKPQTLIAVNNIPNNVPEIKNFIAMSKDDLACLLKELGLAMTLADLSFCQEYFITEKRNPTITEIRVLDTYWSDHCRHTTFNTELINVGFAQGKMIEPIVSTYKEYLRAKEVYRPNKKAVTLMDIATIGAKELKTQGLLNDLDESEEINAASIVVKADIDGREEEWLVMFKNETHNHPTEIEPFGGAATCLGGAIRDPLSGRVYVYQAMRISGSANPNMSVEETLPGKLPQRKITTGAAAGYSSYGNQIGLATGLVHEVYHPGYVAKRMEVGAVVGAAPKENVVRQNPVEGDVILLIGGRTGRDGCGGATGSSKEHDENSLASCGAEVQKGNAPTERKIQRLFRNKAVSSLIKKSNDFGAGGVSVAVGELTDGVDINLDAVLKKYEGLDGTELAISESQERMAVVVAAEDVRTFIDFGASENLEVTPIAKVTATNRLRMYWQGQPIVDICRDFLNTSGVKQTNEVYVTCPEDKNNSIEILDENLNLKEKWLDKLSDLNVCSQKGLIERFDSTIGGSTVLMPLGGKYQLTPAESMVAKLPVLNGNTTTGTVMSYGFNPYISEWSPYHGAVYAVVEAVSKIVATGAPYNNIRLTLQEYFERLGTNKEKWGKPFAALLGAYKAQVALGLPAIGGKDSMSGTFMEINVPPTLVAFAITPANVETIISPEFKAVNNKVYLLKCPKDNFDLPNFSILKDNFAKLYELIKTKKISSAHTVGHGGLCETLSKMTFGNKIGINIKEQLKNREIFGANYGSIVLEVNDNQALIDYFKDNANLVYLGITTKEQNIQINAVNIAVDEALAAWQQPLVKIFPDQIKNNSNYIGEVKAKQPTIIKANVKYAKPRVFIPVFPGTNCEYDTARAFEAAGAEVMTLVFKNLTARDVEKSTRDLASYINKAQMIVLPGGFSAGDEPEGSGKFIAAVFRNSYVKEAVHNLLQRRDGLMLGICNGFQALVKLGLVPYGEIVNMTNTSPTLTFNLINRHMSSFVQTKITSTLSPWLANTTVGDVHSIPISHGEGRFVAPQDVLEKLAQNGQIATQYVNLAGEPALDMPYNPNGSMWAIEAITSPDGRVLGKMAHSERRGQHLYKNIPNQNEQELFKAGVEYYR